MFVLSLTQGDDRVAEMLFDSIEEGRSALASLPGYRHQQIETEGVCYNLEEIDYATLPDYCELVHNGHRYPLSRWSCKEQTPLQVEWREIPYLTPQGSGVVDGVGIVDAYSLPLAEMQKYISTREAKYTAACEALAAHGWRADRNFHGSQDGEAIVYYDKEDKWHFGAHMDPSFVYEAPERGEPLVRWILGDRAVEDC